MALPSSQCHNQCTKSFSKNKYFFTSLLQTDARCTSVVHIPGLTHSDVLGATGTTSIEDSEVGLAW